MAHFFSRVITGGKTTSKTGRKSGLTTISASNQGAVEVKLYFDERSGQDMVDISLIDWNGQGTNKQLYSGPVGGHA